VSEAENLLEALPQRLKNASINDRKYERPMNWDEADELFGHIAELEAYIQKLESALEPFVKVARNDIGLDETDGDTYRPMRAYNLVPNIKIGDLRCAAAAVTKNKKAN